MTIVVERSGCEIKFVDSYGGVAKNNPFYYSQNSDYLISLSFVGLFF